MTTRSNQSQEKKIANEWSWFRRRKKDEKNE